MRIEIVSNRNKKIDQRVSMRWSLRYIKILSRFTPRPQLEFARVADGIVIGGLKCDGEKQKVTNFLRQVCEENSWLN